MAYSCSAPISASPVYDGLALDLIDHLPESCSSLGSGHAHAHASSSRAAVQPQFAAASPSIPLAWDPTPSAPDLFREELFSTLANECNERPTDDAFLAGLQTLSASFAEIRLQNWKPFKSPTHQAPLIGHLAATAQVSVDRKAIAKLKSAGGHDRR